MHEKPPVKSSKAAPKPISGDDIELLPDAWERFEKAVDEVAKLPPQHRSAKKTTERKSRRD